MNMQEGKSYVGIALIVLILIGGFWFFSYRKTPVAPPQSAEETTNSLKELKLFSQGLSAEGIAADQIGFHDFSPNGQYFLFTAFKQSNTLPGNIGYILNTKTGVVTKLPGMPERGIDDDRVMQLYTKGGIILYWLKDGTNKTYEVGDDAFMGSLSPNGKVYVVNTSKGIKTINIDTGSITELSTSNYDGATAWFRDNRRILGYHTTGENLFEAGEGREVGIWNTADSTFTPLGITIPQKSIREATWVVPDKVARINAGYDDGSFDYLVDIENKKVITIGETSGALMGGIKTDPSRNIFAVLGGDDLSASGSKAIVYRGLEKKYAITLPQGYFRESMQIVDDSELLYIRKHMADGKTDKIEVVLADLKTGEEKVLQDLPLKNFTALSLSPDHATYVVSSDATFIVGTIQ